MPQIRVIPGWNGNFKSFENMYDSQTCDHYLSVQTGLSENSQIWPTRT